MLKLLVLGEEEFNNETNEFSTVGDVVLELEHSLAILSKWESIHEKPFLGGDDKTPEEIQDYVRLMIQTPDFSPEVFSRISSKNYEQINDYINQKQSAAWFNDAHTPRSREVITADLIYYWMISVQMPLECEHWHLNRMFTLLKVFSAKNGKQKTMSRGAIAAQNRELNERRRAELGTRG